MKIPNTTISNARTTDETQRYASISLQSIITALNGYLSFQDNMNGKFFSVVFTATSLTKDVPHGLGRVPVGYFVTSKTTNVNIYNGPNPWTESLISFQSTGAAEVIAYVF